MNVKISKLPKSQAELVIELSNVEMKIYITQAVNEIAREVTIPGFRPGKAPYDVLEKQVGAMKIYQRAAEKAVAMTLPKAIVQHNLLTVGQPQITIEKMAPKNPFVYKAIVALLPSIKLGDYRGIKAEKRSIVVENKDVEHTVNNLRKMFGKEKRVARGVQKDDKVTIDMNTFVDNIPIDGGSNKDQPIMVGEGQFIPGFEDALIGMTEGQEKEFELKFPKEYHRKDLAGRPVTFKVKVKGVNEIELPPLNDDFAKMVGQFEKLDELHKQIERNIMEEKELKERQRWELEVIDKILSNSSFGELPDILIEAELKKMLHELENEVMNQGMKFEDYLSSIKKSREDLQKEFHPRAIKRIQTAIALREIAVRENITVDDREVTVEIEKEKEQYKQNPEVLKKISSDQYRDYLKTMLRSRKVFEFLEKNSK